MEPLGVGDAYADLARDLDPSLAQEAQGLGFIGLFHIRNRGFGTAWWICQL